MIAQANDFQASAGDKLSVPWLIYVGAKSAAEAEECI